MKIQRFNESQEPETDVYEEFEDSNQLALYFYNVGGWVGNVILFTNWDDLGNYVINYVNAYILDIYDVDLDDDFDFEDVDPEHLYYDLNNVPCFSRWDEAVKWLNDLNEDGKGITIGFTECKQAKGIIEIEDRVQIAIKERKYNL